MIPNSIFPFITEMHIEILNLEPKKDTPTTLSNTGRIYWSVGAKMNQSAKCSGIMYKFTS